MAARQTPPLHIDIDSAGTADYHSGDPPDLRSQRAARGRGIDLSALRARKIIADDFIRFDLILAMDRANLRDLQAMRPATATAELRLFLEYAEHIEDLDVPDPYYGGEEGFARVLDLTTAAAQGLLAALQKLK